jgi:hypothetical protein
MVPASVTRIAVTKCAASSITVILLSAGNWNSSLNLHEGQVVCDSDWIPKTSAIAESGCRNGLVVRYPIRMKEDLLPVENLSAENTSRLLAQHLEQRGCQLSAEGVAAVAREQLQLGGTLVLHSENAAMKGAACPTLGIAASAPHYCRSNCTARVGESPGHRFRNENQCKLNLSVGELAH